MTGQNEFELLAAVLRYPEEEYSNATERCFEALAGSDPEVALLLGKFLGQTRECSVEELQSLYTATFDLDPVCSLEVGWHLFGENYERGEFLVKMRGELRRLGIAESTELPDHLTHALAALGAMEPEEGPEFAAACLFPALDKMCAGLEGKSNPFENVLLAVARVLERRYTRPDPETVPAGPAFRILDSGGW
jgi:nitrate reductase delta subunit